MAFVFPAKIFHYGFSRHVLYAKTERTFGINLCDLLTTLSTFRSGMLYIFFRCKKKETC